MAVLNDQLLSHELVNATRCMSAGTATTVPLYCIELKQLINCYIYICRMPYRSAGMVVCVCVCACVRVCVFVCACMCVCVCENNLCFHGCAWAM